MTAEQKLAKIKRIFETRRPIKGSRSVVSSHAAFNLEGAIISIEHDGGKCGKVSMGTLNRVAKQLGRISQILDL